MKPQPQPSTQEVLAGLIERVTYHNSEKGFCVLRAKARGHRDVVTVVGEWITPQDLQFRTSCPLRQCQGSIDGLAHELRVDEDAWNDARGASPSSVSAGAMVSDKLLDCSALGEPFVVVGDAKHHALCFKIGDCFRERASFLRAVEPVLGVVDRTGRPVLVSRFPS